MHRRGVRGRCGFFDDDVLMRPPPAVHWWTAAKTIPRQQDEHADPEDAGIIASRGRDLAPALTHAATPGWASAFISTIRQWPEIRHVLRVWLRSALSARVGSPSVQIRLPFGRERIRTAVRGRWTRRRVAARVPLGLVDRHGVTPEARFSAIA